MKLFLPARMAIALCAYIGVLVCIIYPTGMIRRWWMRARGMSASRRREANASHNTRWGWRLARLVEPIIGFRIRVRVVKNHHRNHATRRPCIYVVNHRSALDALILLTVAGHLHNLGVRWVIKSGMLAVPFLGSLMRDTGYAVVIRHKDKPKLASAVRVRFNRHSMFRFLKQARSEAASVGIFPEGERFSGPKQGTRWRHVGELKTEGFHQMCMHLPLHDVAVVRVLWPESRLGKTVFDASVLCDLTVPVEVELHPHVPAAEADAFLTGVWEETERRIKGGVS